MTLTRCQDWILQSLCSVARRAPVTAADLADQLQNQAHTTETYLRQLEDMGLVRSHQVSGEVGWRPSGDGLMVGTVL
ncbi:ArsR family transcriptional regulator [Nocardia ignorata]|uniref:Winged helix DNA-binding protein n=1 Tax=Nocardia ignorata TaxID=145285 RepID=A0A4V6PUI1_NOCIG|nr:ArsR family transcriptional regulator [Nocardia ignorata]TDP29854.1 winged helix DNA-binding protein [Nocardia ignorata]